MSITFYYAPMSSATPVAWALAELGVEHRAVKFDLAAGDQKQPDFLALNPNGKVPTLVADGTPMFEAVAIMQWLGDRYGVDKQLWPAADDPARMQAMAWSTWSYVSFGGSLGKLFVSTSTKLGPEFQNAAIAAYARKELDGLLGVLDGHVARKPYLLGERFSLADLIVGGVIGWAQSNGVSLANHAHAQSWFKRVVDRPSFRAFQ